MGTKLRENNVSERLKQLAQGHTADLGLKSKSCSPRLVQCFCHYLDSILSSTSDYAILSFAPDMHKSIAVSDWLGYPTQLFNNDF